MHLSIQKGYNGARAIFSNPKGSEKPEISLRMQNGKDEMKELRFSSYLVQTAPKIVHRISRNQLVKIKGGKHLQSSNKSKFK